MREIVSPLSGIRSPFGQLSDPHTVQGNRPPLVFDFEADRYRVGGAGITFSDALTFSRASNATLVDSDGVLKWAAHNLLSYSEQFDNAYWSKSNATVASNAAIAPDGESSADKLIESTSTSQHSVNKFQAIPLNADTFTLSIFVKAAERSKINLWLLPNNPNDFSNDGYANFDLSAGEVTSTVRAAASIASVGNGWYKCSITPSQLSSSTSADLQVLFRLADDSSNLSYTGDGASGLFIWGAHVYRSDLGGMVNNPDTGDDYVPNDTGSPRYLPRIGHHVYNGSAWVNEGLLHEIEARTQLLHTTNALVTQSHTVTAVPHTLHFTGTGTVTLSGASTAGPLVGTGTGENNRVSLTFTPSAASLTLTASGTVTNAQLEVGSTPSSHIPNLAGSGTVTRAAETLTIPAANLPWSSSAVSIQMDGRVTYADEGNSSEAVFWRWRLGGSDQMRSRIDTSSALVGRYITQQTANGVYDQATDAGTEAFAPGTLVPFNISSRHGSTFINGAVDGTALTADTTPVALPDLSSTDLELGQDFIGTIKTFRVWADDLGDTGIEAAST